MMSNKGVYTISNLINNKIYVGSTTESFVKRWWKHRSFLRNNKHPNRHLQSAWNKYGENSFIFEILVECDEEYCLSTEQYWITILNVCNKDFGYNNSPTAQNTKGYKFSQESKDKISNTHKLKFKNGYVHPLTNKPSYRRRKVYQFDLLGNFIKEYDCVKNAALSTNTNKTSIARCCGKHITQANNYFWSYIKEFIKPKRKGNNNEIVIVEDIVNNKVYEYNTFVEFALEFNYNRASIQDACKRGSLFQKRFKIYRKIKDISEIV